MKPDREGIWEWSDERGKKHLVAVYNTSKPINDVHLRVNWWGSYYNVNDEHDPEAPENDQFTKAEWPDRWGNFVGEIGSIPDEQLYLMPTPEEMEIIKKELGEEFVRYLDV